MDAPLAFQPDLERFLKDIALCFEIHGGRSAAVVWPQGEATVVQILTAAYGQGEESGKEVAEFIAQEFGKLVGRRASVSYRTVPTGRVEEERHTTADTFTVMLEAAAEMRLAPVSAGWPAEVGECHLRLLAGQVLYIPVGFSRRLSGQHSDVLLLELTLHS
jgi:hypothetical protein